MQEKKDTVFTFKRQKNNYTYSQSPWICLWNNLGVNAVTQRRKVKPKVQTGHVIHIGGIYMQIETEKTFNIHT